MSRKAKFYVATLAAVIQRAAAIAPNKGVAYDKANGMIIAINQDGDGTVTVRSTNLDVFYRERVLDVVEVGTEAVEWRVNAELLNGIVQGLPLGKEATFSQHDGEQAVRITCGRKRATVRLSDPSTYPKWERITEDGMELSPGFGAKVAQVAWAVDTGGNPPFSGVNIDGTRLNATDKYKLAQVECDVPIENPINVPLSILAPILKNLPGDVKVKADDRQLYMRVGEEIEVSSVLLHGDFPDVSKPLRENFTMKIEVDKEQLLDVIQRMLVMVKTERYPWVQFTFTPSGQVEIFMKVEGVGDITDELTIDYDGDEFQIMFTPDFVMKALEGSSQKKVTWELGPDPKLMTRITDGTDYVAWVQPRRSTGEQQGAPKNDE